MDLIYNSKDITSAVDSSVCEVIEFASGFADSLNIIFSDPLSLWPTWKPQKGDQLEANEDTYKSGAMFIDERIQSRSNFQLKAMAVPLSSKTINQKSWENVRLKVICAEIALKYGFEIEFHDIENFLYERVDQNERDFVLLNRLCIREGYNIKINNKKVVIYDERKLSMKPVTIDLSELVGDFEYRDRTEGIAASCIASDNGFKYEAKSDKIGGIIKIEERLYSQAESERFSKNYLWHNQKDEEAIRFNIPLNAGIAGGSLINLTNFGIPDGLWIASQVAQKLSAEKTGLLLRRWSNG